MTCAKFESVIGFHCSPVLLGIKPANLVSLVKDDAGMPAASLMQHYKRKLAKHGVSILPLCERERQTVILVYREDLLTETLQCPKKQKILDKIGYPVKGNVQELLFHLRGRFTDPTEFPHEIGLFLGYPLEDVEGFCRKKGADCKLSGYWKVYGDVETARKRFAAYDRCRDYVAGEIRQGRSIIQVVANHGMCAQHIA